MALTVLVTTMLFLEVHLEADANTSPIREVHEFDDYSGQRIVIMGGHSSPELEQHIATELPGIQIVSMESSDPLSILPSEIADNTMFVFPDKIQFGYMDYGLNVWKIGHAQMYGGMLLISQDHDCVCSIIDEEGLSDIERMVKFATFMAKAKETHKQVHDHYPLEIDIKNVLARKRIVKPHFGTPPNLNNVPVVDLSSTKHQLRIESEFIDFPAQFTKIQE